MMAYIYEYVYGNQRMFDTLEDVEKHIATHTADYGDKILIAEVVKIVTPDVAPIKYKEIPIESVRRKPCEGCEENGPTTSVSL